MPRRPNVPVGLPADALPPKAQPSESAAAARARAQRRAAEGKKAVPASAPAVKKAAVRAPAPPRGGLHPTGIEGVFVNRAGVRVDSRGVALSFRDLKAADDAHFADVVGGPINVPADLLRAVALDPRQPLAVRLDVAAKAAPYFSAKRVAVQGGGEGTPPLDIRSSIESMTQAQLDEFERLNARLAELLAQAAPSASGG